MTDRFNGVTGGNANSNFSLKHVQIHLAVRLRGSSKIRQMNMPGVAQLDRALFSWADRFTRSNFLLPIMPKVVGSSPASGQ